MFAHTLIYMKHIPLTSQKPSRNQGTKILNKKKKEKIKQRAKIKLNI